MTLLCLEDKGLEIFKYPRKDVIRKSLGEFVENYEIES